MKAQRKLVGYGIAVAAVVIVIVLKAVFLPTTAALEAPFLFLLAAVFFTAWSAGLGPGLLATLFAAGVAWYWYLPPYRGFGPPDSHNEVRLLSFLVEGTFISVLSGYRRRSNGLAWQRLQDLQVTLGSIGDAVLAIDRNGRIRFFNPVAEQLTGWTAADAVGRPSDRVLRLIDARSREAVACPAGRALREGTVVVLDTPCVLVGKDGSERFVDDTASPIRDARGQAVGAVVVLKDVTERMRGEAERERLLGRLAAEQDRLRAVLEHIPVGVVLAEAPAGRVVLSNEPVHELLGRPVPVGGRPEWPARGPDGQPLSADAMPLGRALCGEFVRGAEHQYDQPDGTSIWLRGHAAPIRDCQGTLTGAVLVLDNVTREKEAETALRRAHAALRSRLATITEDERRRLSRELHDETSQQLTALILGLKRARDRAPTDPAGAAADLEELQGQAGEISRSLHRIAWELRPAALDDMGLEPALRDAVERWAERTDARLDFHSTLGGRRLRPDVETHVYRIVNEALTNSLRHGRPRRVGVVLDGTPGEVTAIVEDDGRGFDPDNAVGSEAGHRLGLHGIMERAGLIGGSVEIESEPGRGTTVFIRAPLGPPQESRA